MSNKFRYTTRELTVKNQTVGKVVSNVRTLLQERRTGITGVCVNALRGRSSDEHITVAELNTLVEQVYDDSIFYAIR